MRNISSANAISFFVLGMSVCLLYSSEFFVFRRNRVFDGHTCPESKRVFSMDKVYSDIQCAFYCKGSSFCVDIFYQPQERRCDGCRYSEDSELEIADGFLYYTRRGKYSWHIFLVQLWRPNLSDLMIIIERLHFSYKDFRICLIYLFFQFQLVKKYSECIFV
jgi:hypothetical protein